MRRTARRRRTAAAVLLTVCALGVAGCDLSGRPTPKVVETPEYAAPDDLPEAIASDGTTILVGWPKAETKLHFYEDMRCPACKEFEVAGNGAELIQLAQEGKVQARFTLASFLDDKLGGDGSQRAANALRAAVDRGKFTEFHDVLFLYQPEGAEDGFTTERLLELAAKVDGLRGKEFDEAVRTMKYRDFVRRSELAFDRSGVPGTPGMLMDGKRIGDELRGIALHEPGAMTYLVDNGFVLTGPDGKRLT